jgi:hypothetical protein
MQLTRIDRWLRTRFVHEIHVYTMRPPAEIPAGIVCQQLPDTPGAQFRFRFISRRPEPAEDLISRLKDNNQMFTTRVVDRSAWYVPLIAPKDKSAFYWVVWTCLSAVVVFTATQGIRLLWQNPEVRANVLDAIKVLQG